MPIVKWYAVRVTYGRELKFQQSLRESGIESYVPMCRRLFERNGKKEVRMVPAVSNLCFVHVSKTVLDAFMSGMGESCPARYIWDKSTRLPVVVPDKAMEDFIRISSTMADDVIYLREVNPKLREGQKVKVLSGAFAGVEGVVIRVKRSRRVMVELPGMLAVATTYIKPEELEVIA